MDLPNSFICPPSLMAILSISFIVVVFPAPFLPIKPHIKPAGTVKERSSSKKPLYFFVSLLISIALFTMGRLQFV